LKLIAFITFLFLLSLKANASADSLTSLLNKEKTDTLKIDLLLKLGDYYESVNPDSQIYYYNKAIALSFGLKNKHWGYKSQYATALRYKGIFLTITGKLDEALISHFKSIKTSRELTEENIHDAVKDGYKMIGMALTNIAGIKYYKGEYIDAVNMYDAALYVKKLINDKKGSALCMNNKGLILMAQGMNDKALQSFQKAHEQWSTLLDTADSKVLEDVRKGMSLALMNMGIINRQQNNFEVALGYYEQALEIRKQYKDSRGMSECYQNMAIIYNLLNEKEKAFLYYDRALFVFEKLNDRKGIIKTNNNIGALLASDNKCEKAFSYFETAMKFAIESGDKQSVAHINNNISELMLKQQKHLKALDFAQKALTIADSINSLPEKTRAFLNLMESFAGKSDFKEAYKNAKQHIILSDSLRGVEKNKAIQEMESRYQAVKKQEEIEKQRLIIKNNEDEIKRKDAEAAFQQIMLISVISVLILVLFLSWFIYKSYIIKKKAHKEISQKNILLEQANTEITAQRDEIESQRDSIHNQKRHIEKMLDEQTDSIKYAQRIQRALIPSEEMLKEIIMDCPKKSVAEYFVLFKPKDIVSGDFYWSYRTENRLICCVADCTGHGVPGAFMSMLGLSYLNEISKRHDILTAADILNELRKSIVVSLRQQIAEDGTHLREFDPEVPVARDALHAVKDGMDIALFVINTDTCEMDFAGANNSLFIVRKTGTQLTGAKSWPLAKGIKNESKELLADTKPSPDKIKDNDSDLELIELKGDKMPIGVYLKMKPFVQQNVKLMPGDCLYIMSDGFQDQFGGNDYKKFSSRRLRQLILDVAHLSMDEQKEALRNTFREWKGNYQQLDDVCVFGLKTGKICDYVKE
jgi:serine phosphatase RsbU (regulator of sigma subunit)/tetratricopeptide (TPR) repeat protein